MCICSAEVLEVCASDILLQCGCKSAGLLLQTTFVSTAIQLRCWSELAAVPLKSYLHEPLIRNAAENLIETEGHHFMSGGTGAKLQGIFHGQDNLLTLGGNRSAIVNIV
eukprot:922741-Amphidinium_carterae.1